MKLNGSILVLVTMMFGSLGALGCQTEPGPAEEEAPAAGEEQAPVAANPQSNVAAWPANAAVVRYQNPAPQAYIEYAPAAPPAPRFESRGAAPFADAYFVAGHWQYRGGRYSWIAGRWDTRRSGCDYVASRWEQRGTRYVFVPGRWIEIGRNHSAGAGRDFRGDGNHRDHAGRPSHHGHQKPGARPATGGHTAAKPVLRKPIAVTLQIAPPAVAVIAKPTKIVVAAPSAKAVDAVAVAPIKHPGFLRIGKDLPRPMTRS